MNELNLKLASLKSGKWNDSGIALPCFDMDTAAHNAKQSPVWIHFGAGNIFRGFIARIAQRLLEKGLLECGIIAADTFDFEIISRIYAPFDNLTLMNDLYPDGHTECEIIGSVTEALCADCSNSAHYNRLLDIFASPSLQLASFTITEKGYALRAMDGGYLPVVTSDAQAGPDNCRHAMSVLCALVYHRYKTCGAPIALASMDNCSCNGRKLMESVLDIAHMWRDNGFVDDGFIEYLSDSSRCSFPWSMIDKITPRPDASVEKRLADMGIADMSPITTSRGTYIAPFVNAEVPEYLVVEDAFPNGRPPFEEAGVYMTDRDTVNKAERMKVMTCLNPLHTALAVFGCLLGYNRIADEMKDEQLSRLVKRLGYIEGMPVVSDPGILSPEDFLREVLEQRLPNPFIPDMPQRIATDTSQKIPVRFGQTIRAYIDRPDLDVHSLEYIPLVIAGWLRYLLAVDDRLEPMQVSSDPLLGELQSILAGVRVGEPDSCTGKLDAILSNEQLFAANLCECGLSDKIYSMLRQMLAGGGAVRAALISYLGE